MNYQEINVPIGYHYLSEWTDLLNLLPSTGKYILNKSNTGCGGTTLFLDSSRPTILVSPRSNVLYSKAAQYPQAHLFRNASDKNTPVPTLKQRLNAYIQQSIRSTTFGQPLIQKILVTIDSYPYVAEELNYLGYLQYFDVIVDEFQCLLSDSKFKGKTDLEFLHNLRDVKSVCYMSATPLKEIYLKGVPEFADVATYYKLVWDPSVSDVSNLYMKPYLKGQSPASICRDIISNYKKDGNFAQKIINGALVQSKEVVIFLNDVRTIVQIIKSNNLNPKEVNVLCSSSNKYVQDLKYLGVTIGKLTTDKNNPVNCTFTFVSRASFEGVDFYSNSAFTYIFSDGVLAWNKHDLIIDVPQILGRQRLKQPFQKDAVLFYRATSKSDVDSMKERILMKDNRTNEWIKKFNSSDYQTKMMLKDGIIKRSAKTRYADDYVEVVDDLNGGFCIRKNFLVEGVEFRDWQLSSSVYNNPLNIAKTMVGNTNINVSSTLGYITRTGIAELDNFYQSFFKAKTFPDKMSLYIGMREQHPEYREILYQNAFIELKYHQFYDMLGGARIKTLQFRENYIMVEVSNAMLRSAIKSECLTTFVKGNTYLLSDVKNQLQSIYNKVGYKQVAKASDLINFINVERRQLTTPATGKRELYFEIK